MINHMKNSVCIVYLLNPEGISQNTNIMFWITILVLLEQNVTELIF